MTRQPVPPRFTMADRLRKAREEAGLEQTQLAALLGVSRNTVSNIETQKTRPKPAVVARWAAITNTPVTWIESGRRRGAANYDD